MKILPTKGSLGSNNRKLWYWMISELLWLIVMSDIDAILSFIIRSKFILFLIIILKQGLKPVSDCSELESELFLSTSNYLNLKSTHLCYIIHFYN